MALTPQEIDGLRELGIADIMGRLQGAAARFVPVHCRGRAGNVQRRVQTAAGKRALPERTAR